MIDIIRVYIQLILQICGSPSSRQCSQPGDAE